MKNLKPIINNLDDIDSLNLPRRNYQDPWADCRGGSDHHATDNIWPRDRIERICGKYIGKNINKAFTEYCEQVPVYQQHIFTEYFNDSKKYHWYNTYYADKGNNIRRRKYKKKQRLYCYYSDDYKTAFVHKITGKEWPKWSWKENRDDYHYVIIQGYYKEFSWPSPEYLRLVNDQKKRRKKAKREERKEKTKKAYSFLSRSEQEERDNREANRIKILKHGFDPDTSFRGNAANADIISEIRGY